MKDLIVFIDSGDTLVDESTEIRDERGVVLRAELIPGAADALRRLRREGYRIALVADGLRDSFDNVYRQHGLEGIFEVRAISEDLGARKPHPVMFGTAMERMGLTEQDKSRIVMVGNHLERDIAGANPDGAGIGPDELDTPVSHAASRSGGGAGFCSFLSSRTACLPGTAGQTGPKPPDFGFLYI